MTIFIMRHNWLKLRYHHYSQGADMEWSEDLAEMVLLIAGVVLLVVLVVEWVRGAWMRG